MTDSIIGVDCATQPKKMGLARAVRVDGRYKVVELKTGGRGERHPLEVVTGWLRGGGTALLALDAPLGWPAHLGNELSIHTAGTPVRSPSELLFRRLTDRVVAQRTGKTPLDVGADRIARTAHSALLFLEGLRERLGENIPLAWTIPTERTVEAIEVYPAATMLARGGSLKGYKKAEAVHERARLLELLAMSCDCGDVAEAALGSDDCLDAVACVVGGVDFLEGAAVGPGDLEVARREGWIWFREPAQK